VKARLLDRTVLAVGGFVLVAVGGGSALALEPFLASYEVVVAADAGLRSELRAGGMLLLALGVIVICGAVVPRLATVSAILATTAYGAYTLGRALSWVLDGAPASGLIAAGAIELVLAVASAWVLLRLTRRR
jgi:hypothetical protein